MHHVAVRSKGSEADELDSRLWNVMDQGAETGGINMSGMDGGSVDAGERDGGGKRDGLEKIGEGVGDWKWSSGVEQEGCDVTVSE
jgi:hypothetical protein